MHIVGNFIGDGREEIFEYRAGSGADYLFAEFSKVSGAVTYTVYSFTLNLTYSPFAGDFDGDGYDELFWYGGGPNPDYLWKFTGPTDFNQMEVDADALAFPVVGDYTGDGAEDILWYSPGTVGDEIWEYNPGSLVHTVHPISITGTYTPLSGNFSGDGADDVIFYGRGEIPDHRWDFNPGSLTPTKSGFGPLTGDHHRVLTLDKRNDGWTDLFFYNPGSAARPVLGVHRAGRAQQDRRTGRRHVRPGGG